MRQALTTVGRVSRQAIPAAFDILGEGFLEAFGRSHVTVVELALFFVTAAVQWRQHLLTELRALFENRADHVRAGISGPQGGVTAMEVEDIIDQKTHVAQRGFVVRHGQAPADSWGRFSPPR